MGVFISLSSYIGYGVESSQNVPLMNFQLSNKDT